MFAPEVTVRRIRQQLQRLRAAARLPSGRLDRVTDVSAWSPSEHLDHVIKVTRSILEVVNDPNAARVSNTTNFLGRLILTFGWIPRGRGRSPERLRGTLANSDVLLSGFDELEALLDRIDVPKIHASREVIVPHPRFGGLTGAEGLRFIEVHADHHLKIIEDIERRPALLRHNNA